MRNGINHMGFYFSLIQQSFIRTKQALCQMLGTGMVQLTPQVVRKTDAQSRNSLSVQYSVSLGEFYKELMVLCKSLNSESPSKGSKPLPHSSPSCTPLSLFPEIDSDGSEESSGRS